ncbi:STAS domain-containing protein [Humisphaera borealis]|uniref:Anti-sigma factor antagonist n=1 Tax=Humisphaera borealis TaxID=2807512 RepID=A0A7M2X4A3_9BACT|nr:STAS domain-containing protein [Humisphaera borealis]QOV91590.1 STAS domain-containing protein [Humisphaera borealis]
MSRMTIIERQSGSVTILDLAGKLTSAECGGALHGAVRTAIDQGKKRLLLNLAAVSHIDSSGIGELVSSYTTTVQSGGHFKLLNVTGMIHDVLSRTRMLAVFQTYSDERRAVESY